MLPRAVVDPIVAHLAAYVGVSNGKPCVCVDFDCLGVNFEFDALVELSVVEEGVRACPLDSDTVRWWIADRLLKALDRAPRGDAINVIVIVARARALRLDPGFVPDEE